MDVLELRKRLGLSRLDVAKASGVSEWLLFRADAGVRPLKPAEEERCRQALEAEMARLCSVAVEYQRGGANV